MVLPCWCLQPVIRYICSPGWFKNGVLAFWIEHLAAKLLLCDNRNRKVRVPFLSQSHSTFPHSCSHLGRALQTEKQSLASATSHFHFSFRSNVDNCSCQCVSVFCNYLWVFYTEAKVSCSWKLNSQSLKCSYKCRWMKMQRQLLVAAVDEHYYLCGLSALTRSVTLEMTSAEWRLRFSCVG